jgi:hypothetical protein
MTPFPERAFLMMSDVGGLQLLRRQVKAAKWPSLVKRSVDEAEETDKDSGSAPTESGICSCIA